MRSENKSVKSDQNKGGYQPGVTQKPKPKPPTGGGAGSQGSSNRFR
jgi:hypothetical protein